MSQRLREPAKEPHDTLFIATGMTWVYLAWRLIFTVLL